MAEKKVTKTKEVKAAKPKVVKTKEVKAEVKKEVFAVVDVNATQLLVKEGEKYEVKKIDTLKGKKYESEKVLLVVEGDKVHVGKPYVKDAKVVFEVLAQTKGDKVDSFKYKAKSRYRKHIGSRALITRIQAVKIEIKGK